MKTGTRNLYTVLSLLPAFFFLVYIISFISLFMSAFHHMGNMNTDGPPVFLFGHFGWIFITAIIMLLVWFAAMVLFIMHAINNKSLPENERIIWILVFIFAGMIGFPLYWFMRGIRYNPGAQESPIP